MMLSIVSKFPEVLFDFFLSKRINIANNGNIS